MAQNEASIYVRLPQETREAIEADIKRINRMVPSASVTMSSWIRAAIDAQLERAGGENKKRD